MATVGEYLIRSLIPPKYLDPTKPLTKKVINTALADYAADDPQGYVKNIPQIKKLGDAVSTYEGISVGLDDIQPEYKKRDPILKSAFNKIKKITSVDKKREELVKVQNTMLDLAAKHPGDLGLMVRSGGRGKAAQLMRMVTAPVAVSDWNGNIVPWMIKHSFSEGLRPDEYWATTSEARKLAVMSNNSVTEPGEMSKMLVHTMGDQVITEADCGTHNGLYESIDSPKIIDRFLAKQEGPFPRNTLLNSQTVRALKKAKIKQVTVRSPMTCESDTGVCQYCYGINVYGKLPEIGTNIGMRGAQALSEPLTQAMLSSKHGMRVESDEELSGLSGMKLLLNVPKTFPGSATLADNNGHVTDIVDAPQGGKFVYIDNKKHYVPPALRVTVKKGQRIEAGDALSTGIPKPDEIVNKKGIGRGRVYYANRLYDLFSKTITDVDPRHLETLSRAHIRYGKIEDDPTNKFIRGDIVPYTKLKKIYETNKKTVPITKAQPGDILANNYHEFVSGTHITEGVKNELAKRGIKEIEITDGPVPRASFIMKPLTHAPLLDPDWVARLAHRNIKNSLLTAAANAEESNIHSYNPVAGYLYGADFGNGPGGTY